MKKLKNIILWSLMRLFSKRPWFKSTDGGIIQPDKGTISRFFYDALSRIYYPKPTEKQSKQKEELTIEKRLDHSGYVQHPTFWQKGFVRCAKDGEKWEVWHNVGSNPKVCTRLCADEGLFETLKYYERI